MDNIEIKNILEALLMQAAKPMSLDQMLLVFDDGQKPTRSQLLMALEELALDYQPRAIELKVVASGYVVQTKINYSRWIERLYEEKPPKYSKALLETLAIIAYRQPVTRADIEDIRGVANSSTIKTLLEREWIKVAGHRDIPGKPLVYVTTKAFLDYFNLASLEELPLLPAIEGSVAKLTDCVEELS